MDNPLLLHVWPDFRYAEINRENETGTKILRAAKRAAQSVHKGAPLDKPLDALKRLLEPLETQDLNVLAAMHMIWHPTVMAGATGQGGIWAMASDIVNNAARDVLRSRPAFEVGNRGER